MPISGSCTDFKGHRYFIDLWKKFRDKKLQECPICFRKNVNRSQSHIIPESMLCMADTVYIKQNNKIHPRKMTEKLLCSSSKSKSGYQQMELSCEEMLSSSEETLCDLLAGSSWVKKDGPTNVQGLIQDVQKAVDSGEDGTVEFCTNMEHRHALLSIAYRILMVSPTDFVGNTACKKKIEESVGILAKKLHDAIVFPNTDQTVHLRLLFSAKGTRAIPELHVKQVVPFDFGSFVAIVVHFGLRGLHFIVTDSDLLIMLPSWSQRTYNISGDSQLFRILFKDFKEENGVILSCMINAYTEHKFDLSVASSSVRVDTPEGVSPRELSDCDVIRLPNGFSYNYNKITLQLGNNWTLQHEKDMSDISLTIEMNSKNYCFKKMWILNHSHGGLNAVFSFVSDSQKHLVFGFSLSDEKEIKGPMFKTTFERLSIHENLKVFCATLIKECLATS